MNLHNAKLEGVTQFLGIYMSRTAWWEAQSINKPLLEYLMAECPLNPELTYGRVLKS